LPETEILLHLELELHDLAIGSVGRFRENSSSREIVDKLPWDFLQSLFGKFEGVVFELPEWDKLNVVPSLVFLELI